MEIQEWLEVGIKGDIFTVDRREIEDTQPLLEVTERMVKTRLSRVSQ